MAIKATKARENTVDLKKKKARERYGLAFALFILNNCHFINDGKFYGRVDTALCFVVQYKAENISKEKVVGDGKKHFKMYGLRRGVGAGKGKALALQALRYVLLV